MTFLEPYVEPIYAALRIVAAFLYVCHGAQKLFGAFGGPAMTGVPLLLAAAVIEVVAGVLIACGLLTELAAFVASGEMAVAYFKAHFPHGFWPIENKGELAVLFCFLFLYVAARGGGRFSLDAVLRGRRRAA